MANIDIKKKHSLGKEKAKLAADTIAQRLKEKLQVQYDWTGDALNFHRSGAEGSITVAEDSVRVQVKLGLMLRPLKGTVEQQIQKYLDEGFAAS